MNGVWRVNSFHGMVVGMHCFQYGVGVLAYFLWCQPLALPGRGRGVNAAGLNQKVSCLRQPGRCHCLGHSSGKLCVEDPAQSGFSTVGVQLVAFLALRPSCAWLSFLKMSRVWPVTTGCTYKRMIEAFKGFLLRPSH